MIDDEELQRLIVARRQMLQDLAHVLRRVGFHHPQRAKVNKQRAIRRKALRKSLRLNAEQCASRCVELFEFPNL